MRFISLALCLLAFCLLPLTTTAQSSPDIPVIQVRTEGQKSKAIGTPAPYSRPSKHPKPIRVEIQSVAVRVDLRSFHPPKGAYDVQCFAIARSDADGSEYIYHVQRRRSWKVYDTVLFETVPLDSSGKKWIRIPLTEVAANGKIVSADPIVTKPVKGVKYYGWVVRVISNNVAVRHESNQPELRIAAEKTPTAFDMAAATID
jgi:hypothetical protein